MGTISPGQEGEAIDRISNLYTNSRSIIVVNNVLGRAIPNIRQSIRQGDKASMEWFTFGIDPVITYLENRLAGILIHSLRVQGPLPSPRSPPLPPQELRYKVIAYCDDVKPAITTMQEFILVDKAMDVFEKSSGCRMHRDPASDKCKFLPLGRWRGTLTQEDLPCNFFSLSDHLDMLGVTLKATYTATRKENGDELQAKMKNIVGSWKAGKFMPLNMRPHSLNCFAFSKLWHKCSAIDLRLGDITAINKIAKSWLYADLLEKPSELALYRHPPVGGLGLYNIKARAMANLINNFLETACNPRFRRNSFHEALFKLYVLEDDSTPKIEIPPYFKGDFFPAIRRIYTSPLNVANIRIREIYRFLAEETTMNTDVVPPILLPLRVELACPTIQWDRTWSMARQHMLGPELTSFLFMMLHQILPTAERVARILPNQTPYCNFCEDVGQFVDTQQHAMFDCRSSKEASTVLLQGLKKSIPEITPAVILTLGFDYDERNSFPIVWAIAQFLSTLWQLRIKKKPAQLIKIRSDMEASCRLLRESRLQMTLELVNQIFT